MVCFRFQKLNFDQKLLVVHLFQFSQQVTAERKWGLKVLQKNNTISCYLSQLDKPASMDRRFWYTVKIFNVEYIDTLLSMYRAMRRASSACRRKVRFSDFAQSMHSFGNQIMHKEYQSLHNYRLDEHMYRIHHHRLKISTHPACFHFFASFHFHIQEEIHQSANEFSSFCFGDFIEKRPSVFD